MRVGIASTIALLFLAAICSAQLEYACDGGYSLYLDWCFRVYSTPRSNFDEAVEICRHDGGDLASIRDEADNVYIQHFKATGVLIGIRYNESSDSYFWSDCQKVGYTSFANDYVQKREFYGYCAKTVNGRWTNAQCDSDRYDFVCSKKAYSLNITTTTRRSRCPEMSEYTTPGMLVSPGYPSPYSFRARPSGMGCQYQLLAPNNNFVEIAFEEFNISDGAFIVYKTDSNDEKTEVARVGQEFIGKKIIVHYNRVFMHVANSTTGTWKITWRSLKPAATVQNRRDACPIREQILTTPGTVESPGYPEEFVFSKETETTGCSYAILAEGRYVLLELQEVRFPNSSGWIDVYKGWTKEDRVFRADNNNESHILVVPSSKVLIHVHSASHGKFKIRWLAVQACEPGWQYFKHACYFFNNNTMSHSNASKYCNSQGANLTSIHSQGELSFLTSHLSAQHFFIGLVKNGAWRWTDGTDTDYLPWTHYEPNYCCPANAAFCGTIQPYYTSTYLGDENCALMFKSICKKRIYGKY